MIVESEFAIKDKVNVDGCKELTGVITGIIWRHPTIINYEVSWVVAGKSESSVIEGWRLTLAEDR